MLKAGIVGLPNVGKSTLINALTGDHKAQSANYPFCTIEPNVGMVTVPDSRLAVLQAIAKTNVVIPAVFEFVDIAGLVRGASKGEGLGNQFLAHIRETDAIVQVLRCFEDDNITHVDGSVDPIRDYETILIELCLADSVSLNKRMERLAKSIKQQDKTAMAELAVYEKLKPIIEDSRWVDLSGFTPEERVIIKQSQLLTVKPLLFAANLSEEELADPNSNPHYANLTALATELGVKLIPISAQIESELSQLDVAERDDYLQSLGVNSSGVDNLIKAAYDTLGLITYFTAGEKEVRAWPFPEGSTAPQCAGVIHTDFEKGFIRAEVIGYTDYVSAQGEKGAKENGTFRLEGKDYLMKDGDVVHFRFNV
jgi:ribosome-binding ATPase